VARQRDQRSLTFLRFSLQLDFLGKFHDDGVAVTEAYAELLALRRSTVTNTYHLQLHFVALRHTNNHVVDQCAVKAVLGTDVLVIVGAAQRKDAVRVVQRKILVHLLRQLPFGAFDSHNVALDGEFNSTGNGDGIFSNSAHDGLVYGAKNFTTHVQTARFFVGHHPLACGNDADTEAIQDARELAGSCVPPKSGLGVAFDFSDGRTARLGVVTQGNFDVALVAFVVELVVQDVPLVEQDFGQLLLHVGSRNLHHLVTGQLRIADAREVIGYRIAMHVFSGSDYQLAFFTPGMRPDKAILRNNTRLMPN